MLLERLLVREFRTWPDLDWSPPAGVTCIAGPNGVGKTNLLEACAWVLCGSSPRTSAEARGIRDGSGFFRLSARVRRGTSAHEVAVTYASGSGKQLSLDGDRSVAAEQLAATLPVVVFLPERLLVVRGAPARRRGTLDRLVSRLDPRAATVQRAYARAVTQRNVLLRRARAGSTGSAASRQALAPWTGQVAAYGQQLRQMRHAVLAALQRPFSRRLEQLTGSDAGRLELTLRGGPDLALQLEELLPTDTRRGTTGAGPHLDDLLFLHGDRDLRSFGSTGEQRAALLAWALAEHDATAAVAGVRPLVLLDEPYAELDADRRARLTDALTGLHQAIVTATEPPASLLPSAAELLSVSSGQLTPWPDAKPIPQAR